MTEVKGYSIAQDFAGVAPNIRQLQDEVTASSIVPVLNRVVGRGDQIQLVFSFPLTETDCDTLDALIAAHVPVAEYVQKELIGVITPRVNRTKSNVYERVASFVFAGTLTSKPIKSFECISYMHPNLTSYSIRVYDPVNQLEIALGTFTNTAEATVTLSSISSLPTGKSTLEVQIKRNGGNGTTYAYIDSITMLG